jgi:oligopeptide transport system substrate-binding protein
VRVAGGAALALRLVLAAVIVSGCTVPPEPPPPLTPQPEATDPAEGPTAAEDEDREGGTLRVGLEVDPATLDPRFLVDEEGQLVADALFDPLVRLDDELRVVPAAARRWALSVDRTELTFMLRDASFHDGTPVTAEDFVRTFRHIADGSALPRSFVAHLLAPVAGFAAAQAGEAPLRGVEALDDTTLRITLNQPEADFLATLADPSLVPVPPDADEDQLAFAEQPVGNGPFLMSEPREREAFLRLRRNEAHHTPPLLDEVLLQIYPEDPTRDGQWEDLLEGQLQVAQVPPERRDEAVERFGRALDGRTGPGFVDGLTSAVYLYGFDTTTPPFDLPALRRAISLSIDREALAVDVMQGSRAPAVSIVPPPLPGSQAGACGHCRHDPEAAREELERAREQLAAAAGAAGEAAGGGDDGAAADEVGGDRDVGEDGDADGDIDGAVAEGVDAADGDAVGSDSEGGVAFVAEPETGDAEIAEGTATEPDRETSGPGALALDRLTLTHNRGRTHAAIAERMAADIEAALDIEVELDARDLQPFLQGVQAGEVPVFRLGWDPAEARPGAYLRPLFHSSQIGGENVTRYANEDVDRYLDEARAAPDETLATAWYRQAEQRILEDAPVLPLLWYRQQRVVAPEVQGLRVSPLGRWSFADAWLESDG